MHSPAACLGIGCYKPVVGFVWNADPGVHSQCVCKAEHDLQRHTPAGPPARRKSYERKHASAAACNPLPVSQQLQWACTPAQAKLWRPTRRDACACTCAHARAHVHMHMHTHTSCTCTCTCTRLSVDQNVCLSNARSPARCIWASLVRCQSMKRIILQPAGGMRVPSQQLGGAMGGTLQGPGTSSCAAPDSRAG